MKRKKFELFMAVIIILFALFFSNMGVQLVSSQKVKEKKNQTIVIDSGHGGMDGGKISVLGDYEKDINLSIAKKLQALLKKAGYKVIMTREDDQGLYSETSANKKAEDMKARCSIIDTTGVTLAVSIHQNSYHQESVNGAQVFYYESSDQGKKLAETIQTALVDGLDKSNTRKAKSNTTYYLLRKTSTPIVIVECGFLSNYDEAKKLVSDTYQEKVAKAIFQGIETYLENEDEN